MMTSQIEDVTGGVNDLQITSTEDNAIEDEENKQMNDIEDFKLSFFEKYKSRNETETNLVRKLRNFQCPFTWSVPASAIKSDGEITNNEKSDVLECNSLEVPFDVVSMFSSYRRSLYYVYCEALVEQYDKSLQSADRIVTFVMENSEKLNKIAQGMLHVLNNTKASIFMLKGDYERCKEYIDESLTSSSFDSIYASDRAAVIGTYGQLLFHEGIENVERSEKLFRKCIEMDPEYFLWHFLLGRSLVRIRQFRNRQGKPSDDEINELRMAVEMATRTEGYPSFYLAQTISNKARFLHFNGGSKEMHDNLNDEARSLFDYLFGMRMTLSSSLLTHLADGYMKLPWANKSIRAAEQCLTRAMEIDKDNSYIYVKMSNLCEFYKKDFKQALFFMLEASKLCSSFSVDLKVTILQTLLNSTFNPIERLTQLLEKYTSIYTDMTKVHKGVSIIRGHMHYLKYAKLNEAIEEWRQAYLLFSNPTEFGKEFTKCANFCCFTADTNIRLKIKTLPKVMTDWMTSEKEITDDVISKVVDPITTFTENVMKKRNN